MRFSRETRLRLAVALVAVLAVAGLTGLVTLTSRPTASTADLPPPPVAAPPLALPPPLPPVPLPPPVLPLPLPPAPTTRPPAPRPPAPAPACVAPPGGQRDVDVSDPADPVWARTRGQKVVVYFETGRLPARYANVVAAAAGLWSRSTCVAAVATPRCPPRSRCSTVTTAPTGGDEGEDGTSRARMSDGVRVGNAITLYTALLDTSTGTATLGTVVHEMGHALGLRHRNDPRSIMNATTGDDTDPRPDSIDFWNLAVLYGERST